MYNKKVLIDSLKNLSSAKAPTKPKDKIFSEPLVSNEGYKQGPPPAGSHYRIPGNENGTSIYNPTPYALNLVGPNGTQTQIEPWDTNIQYFDEPYIDEYPQMKKGGALLTKKVTCKNCGWKWNAADGGDDVTTCHKCGSQGLVHAQDGGEYIETELTPEEIEEYRKGGFIVEDISVPELNQFQTGGSGLLRSAVNQLSLFDDPVKVLKKNITPKLITNVSGFTMPQIQKTLLPQYKNLTDKTFKNTVFSPSGKLYEAPQFSLQDFYDPLAVGYSMPFGDYKNEFNSRLDMLNSLIEKNNTSGIPYESLGLTNDGLLKFKSPHGISAWNLKIQPGSFTNENLEDIIDPVYWRGIPGLEMSDTSQGVFGPGFNIEGNIPRGTSAYRSLNDYMKKFNLGRVKSGFNAQTPEGMSAWEKLIKNNEAIGYFERPDRIFGIMKKDGGELQLGDEVDEATMKKLEELGYTFEKI